MQKNPESWIAQCNTDNPQDTILIFLTFKVSKKCKRKDNQQSIPDDPHVGNSKDFEAYCTMFSEVKEDVTGMKGKEISAEKQKL